MAYNTPQDEGYSEDPLNARSGSNGMVPIPSWVTGLSIDERARLAVAIIKGLPTTMVAEIVDTLRPRLCLDFIERLPTEACLKILGYLDPISLINMALASKNAKALAFDWTLWQNLYYLEGWRTVPGEVEAFQQELNARSTIPDHVRPETDSDNERQAKKRATASTMSRGEDTVMSGVDQPSLFGGPIMSNPDELHPAAAKPELPDNSRHLYSARRRTHYDSAYASTSPTTNDYSDTSSIVTVDRSSGRQTINWRHLYTMRRRLESNWDTGKFVNFQIPHPQHSYQAHSECIYTIQFQGRYLVSGSRDRSLRIWDMETRQLVLPPLIGHTGSVLCLQFDSDPSEDLIVSGSSDSSVILWRFSTGRAIQTLKHAHRESVLNVRFDHRILVTCSKDKMIKIFNRTELCPGDLGYPVSHGVAPVPVILNNYGFNPSPLADGQIIKKYSLIGVLEGHGAAVNAVQIWKNEIVSASGDRNVKVWNWPTQSCIRTLIGHTKGIACVQYDGRRIVSGSSDNAVMVFDKETGLEVARLSAHSSLVRTVQAGFGDLPFSMEDDLALAKQVDNQYFEAVEQGSVNLPLNLGRRRPRNAGSMKPEHIMAYGAKLPPGGAGGKYGRIVSGSYDESVIIWRRDKEGEWKAKHVFRQELAARAAEQQVASIKIPLSSRPSSGALLNGALPYSDNFFDHFVEKALRAGPPSLRQLLHSWPALLHSQRLRSGIEAESNPELRADFQLVYNSERNTALIANRLPPNQSIQNNTQSSEYTSVTRSGNTSNQGSLASGLPPPNEPLPLPLQLSSRPPSAVSLPNQALASPSILPAPHLQQALATGAPPLGPQLLGGHHGHAHGQGHHHPRPAATEGSQARVFKLQYDARRIVCCSQTSIVVGWDFANRDDAVEEACRFFGTVD